MATKGPHRSCGTEHVHERLLKTDPNYAANRGRSENFALEYARIRGRTGRTGITVIPVVVHVIYKAASENISDEQINSQIDVLNKDYRKANDDISTLPAAFSPLAADARIEFQLATIDPSGNPTNGITRTSTTATSFSDDDEMKSAATGGHDAWPRDNYLNIWVCKLGGGLLGYAQFPGGPAATDGVVITYTAFGTVGTAVAPFNLGRTATHEVGHFLNLRHIWGDERPHEDPCSKSDFVGDTPNQAGPNYGTPTYPHVTCGNGPDGDLFMNYMDYVDDVSMFMFTSGQVTRMHACLDGDRASLGFAKPTPTIKFQDDPTLKFRDDPTLKFRDDPTLKFRDDPTLKFRDDPTLKFRDDPTLKFRDDPTLKFKDDPQTLKFRDDIRGTRGTAPPPGGTPSGAPYGNVPFILSTPHHSMAWARSFPDAYEAELASLQHHISQVEQLLEEYQEGEQTGVLTDQERQEADQVYQEYQQLVAEYQRMTGEA